MTQESHASILRRHTMGGEMWGRISPEILAELGETPTPGSETHFVLGPRGRRLAVEITGPADGYTVVFNHGGPGGRFGPKPDASLTPGVRLVAYDRSGYGLSMPNPGRRPVDAVDEVRAIVEYLGSKSFGVAGRSGGTPPTLAIASRLEGVERAAVIVPVGPYELMGQSWYEGMNRDNEAIFRMAYDDPDSRRSLPSGRPYLRFPIVTSPERGLYSALDNLRRERLVRFAKMQAAPNSEHGFSSDELRGFDLRSMAAHAAAMRTGCLGWADDILGFANWGFDPSEVEVPTLIWAAKEDNHVPAAHAGFIAERIGAAATLHIQPGASHFDGVDATATAINWCVPV